VVLARTDRGVLASTLTAAPAIIVAGDRASLALIDIQRTATEFPRGCRDGAKGRS